MVKFTTNKRWSEKAVAVRVAQIVRGEGSEDDNSPPWEISLHHWQLDRGNDWWLDQTGENEYLLKYRYATPDRQAMLEGLVPFLQYIFD